jgi:hypothetical protein
MAHGHGNTEFPEKVFSLIFVQFHKIQPLFHSDGQGNVMAFSVFVVKLGEKRSRAKNAFQIHQTAPRSGSLLAPNPKLMKGRMSNVEQRISNDEVQ